MSAAPIVWDGVVRLADIAVVPEGRECVVRAGTRVVVERRRPASAPAELPPGVSAEAPAIVVRGTLLVEGNADAPVIFFPEGDWGGLVVAGSGRASLAYARLDGAGGDVVTALDDARVELRDCRLQWGRNGARCAGRARLRIAGGAISDESGVGVLAEDEGVIELEGVALRQNPTAVTLLGSSTGRIERCRVEGGIQCGVNAMGRARVVVRGCELTRNHTALSGDAEAAVDARDNAVHGNLLGVHLGGRSRGNLVGNRFGSNAWTAVDVTGDALVRSRLEPAAGAA